MNNDLISRSALKKEVENLVVGGAERLKDYYENGSKKEETEWIGGVYDAWELIDNAPTVEMPIAIGTVDKNGNIKIEPIRTTVEWGKWVISEIRCPNCLEYFQPDCYSMGELNKCPCCGTKMITHESQ